MTLEHRSVGRAHFHSCFWRARNGPEALRRRVSEAERLANMPGEWASKFGTAPRAKTAQSKPLLVWEWAPVIALEQWNAREGRWARVAQGTARSAAVRRPAAGTPHFACLLLTASCCRSAEALLLPARFFVIVTCCSNSRRADVIAYLSPPDTEPAQVPLPLQVPCWRHAATTCGDGSASAAAYCGGLRGRSCGWRLGSRNIFRWVRAGMPGAADRLIWWANACGLPMFHAAWYTPHHRPQCRMPDCVPASGRPLALLPLPAGTLRVYGLKQRAVSAPELLVQGRTERAVVRTADGLYINIANVNELKQLGRLPDGWGWDAEVTITGRT